MIPMLIIFPGPDFWQTSRADEAPDHIQTSGITMPPVHGFVLWRLYELAEDKKEARSFLKELFPKVLAAHRYLYENRDPEEEGLVHIRHPWEGGTDNSPIWDSALKKINPNPELLPAYQRKDLQNPKAVKHRPTQQDYDRYVYLVDLFRKHQYKDQAIYANCPFAIQDPLFNGILAWSNEALIKIGALLGEEVNELISWHELTLHSMNEKLWNEERGIYDAYDLYNDEKIAVSTSSGMMPMCGEVPTQEQAELILQTLESETFGGENDNIYLCPTYDLQAEDINYHKYWRGPVWINMNWLLYHGLMRYDMVEMAEKIRTHSLELLEKYGFFEYFDPRRDTETEGACGTDNFSWSAALCIDWLNEDF